MTLGAPAALVVRQRLAARDLRKNLHAILVRRLPAEDVDDVAQTVLCDALAAERIPQDPVEMRRWLAGIARHKVADFHRSRARLERRTEPLDDDGAFEPACPPPPVEVREVLAQVLGEASSPRDEETLSWLVREHHGDRLADIAKEAGLPSPVVRQRVSRLRRALRDRWAGALLVLLAFGAALGAWRRSGDVEAIGPDPAAPPVAAAASPLDGVWHVVRVRPDAALNPAQRALLDAEAARAEVKVHGARIEIAATSGRIALTAKDVSRAKDGTITATLVTAAGTRQKVRIVPEGDLLRVVVAGGRITGEAWLRR